MARGSLQKHAPVCINDMNLPASIESKRNLTFKVPHIILNQEDQNGFQVLQVRLGGNRQIEFTTNISYSEEPVEETAFIIKATNRINFGDGAIHVLNDVTDTLAASSPTASEYMENVGKTVMTSFSCNLDAATSKQLGGNAFKVVRITITLP